MLVLLSYYLPNLTNFQKLLFQVLLNKSQKIRLDKTAVQDKLSKNRFDELSSVYRNL